MVSAASRHSPGQKVGDGIWAPRREATWVSSSEPRAMRQSWSIRGPGIAELFGMALAFDGELYAAGEARAHLVRHGVHFVSDSLLELLMHGLSREGRRSWPRSTVASPPRSGISSGSN